MHRHRESPVKRTNPSGKTVWVARWTPQNGPRTLVKPKATFPTKGEAQQAIDAAYEAEQAAKGRPSGAPSTLRTYLPVWLKSWPRSARTADTNERRIKTAIEAPVFGEKLGDWPLAELRRKHAHELVAHLLIEQKRAQAGAGGILRALSALAEDAITDELTDHNAFKGVKVAANDPRITKRPREVRVWTFEQMHAFAAAAGRWEPMIRVFSDCGLRLGEVLPLERSDLEDGQLTVRRTAHEGVVTEGTKTTHGRAAHEAMRIVPVSASPLALIRAMPKRIDTRLLFPTSTGKLWRERNFYRDVWTPTQEATGMDIRPHEMRHSWITHLRAEGVHDADLAQIAGHSVETMVSIYTHPAAQEQAFEQIAAAIG